METKKEVKDVRESVIAGSWYPGDKSALAEMIDGFLENAKKDSTGDTKNIKNIRALMVPHAGYMYSGQVAAFGYKEIIGREYNKVIILAPSHHYPFRGASIVNKTHYRTPLGDVKISAIAGKIIEESKEYMGTGLISQSTPAAHEKEHSLEIQLPFLQRTLKNFEIIPIITGQLSPEDREKIAGIIINHLDENTLVIASSDLSHYHPYDVAVELDTKCVNAIASLNARGAGGCEMCGYDPVLITMLITERLNGSARLLKYANSGDVTGDKSGVVGYSAIAFSFNIPPAVTKEDQNTEKNTEGSTCEEDTEKPTEEEQKYLLGLARNTIELYLKEKKVLEPETSNPRLKKNLGAFVTLEKHGQLRGCIGHIRAVQPLYLDVRDNAINAAVNDPRFMPMTVNELDDIKIEISVLTTPELIVADTPEEYLDEIVPLRDGIIIEYGGRSATYLPQVWEQLTGKEEFLGSLCSKAGLSRDTWRKKGIKIYRYSAHVFSE